MLNRCIFIMSVALILSACATQPSRLVLEPIGPAEEQQLHSLFNEAKALVEEMRGVELTELNFKLSTTEEIGAKVLSHYRLFHHNSPAEQQLTKTKAFQSAVRESADWLHGLYLPLTKELLVNSATVMDYSTEMSYEHDIPKREFIMALMIHELVHAADDIEFDIIDMHRRSIGDELGVQMVIEGHAQLLTEQYCQLAGCANAVAIELEDAKVPDKVENELWVESARKNNFYLLYGQGYDFLHALHNKDSALVNHAMRNPPGSIPEFFDASSYPNFNRQKSREVIFNILGALELPDIALLQRPQPRFNDLTLPIEAQARQKHIEFLLTHEVVTGSMVYYDQENLDKPALHIQITKTKSADYSKKVAQHSVKKYRQLKATKDLHRADPTIATNTKSQPGRLENLWSGTSVQSDEYGNNVTVIRHVFLHGSYIIFITNQDNRTLNQQVFTAIQALLDSQTSEHLAASGL